MTLARPRLSAAELTVPLTAEFAGILTPGRWNSSPGCSGGSIRAVASCWPAANKCRPGSTPVNCLTFLPQTRGIRESEWRVVDLPADLRDRRVEITGPVDRKMVINALNSGAKTYMADFEDSHSPTWEATIQGQINLRDAVRGTIEMVTPEGKQYLLNRANRHAFGAAARLASGREARASRRPAGFGIAV